MKKLIPLLALATLTTAAPQFGSMTDSRDGQTYRTVKIGKQTWMAQNLNYGLYINDGASASTKQLGAQKFCYDNIASNCDTDGGLYQWHTAMGISSTYARSIYTVPTKGNIQGICPAGWHIPRASEWDALEVTLGGSAIAGKRMKARDAKGWNTSNNDGNTSGFSAFPAGYRFGYGGFDYRGFYADFWEAEQNSSTSAQNSSTSAWSRNLYDSYSGLSRSNSPKVSGFSVRCLKDN